MKQLIVSAVAFLLMSTSVYAQTATEFLDEFSKNVVSARGTYSQTSIDKNDKPRTPVTKGNFAFKRPGLFYWNTTEPFAQKIVSDASKLWLYDPDLAQVTVRNLKGVLGATPAAILFGQQSVLSSFVVSDLPQKDSLLWLNARPKNEEPSYKSIDIAFDKKGMLSVMVLHDHFGEKTVYRFAEVEINPAIKDSDFTFEVPKGTDVIEDNSQLF